MYRIFDAQHVYKFLRNLETRMYRTCGAQHGYEPIGSEPRKASHFKYERSYEVGTFPHIVL